MIHNHTHRHENNRQLFVRRALVFAPVLFLLAVAQCSFFAQLKILPAVPDLMLGAVVAIAMLDSQKSAAVCGIGAGFLIDAIGATGLSFSPLFYMLCGAICGVTSRKMLQSFLSFTVQLGIFSLLKSFYSLAIILSKIADASFVSTLTRVLLPETLLTFVICLPTFFIIKLCMIPIDSKRRLRLDKFD